MNNLSALERVILAVLEEAGEEDISALTNTVRECRGALGEIDEVSAALAGLVNRGFVEVARSKDPLSLRWVPTSKQESLALLRDLKPHFHWSTVDQLWAWRTDLPRAEVLLTNIGAVEARRVLSEDGVPRQS
jgi:hypothetical protein